MPNSFNSFDSSKPSPTPSPSPTPTLNQQLSQPFTSPCLNCLARKVGCHSHCSSYQDFSKANAERKSLISKEKLKAYICSSPKAHVSSDSTLSKFHKR